MAKGRVVRQAPFVIAVQTDTAGIQFIREVEDSGVTRKEFCVRPHDATRYKTKKDADRVCRAVPPENYPTAFSMTDSLNLIGVANAKSSDATH